jgi:SAM-dependent methyltransferase
MHVENELRTEDGGEVYPVRDGVPILIDDESSAFAVADFTGPDSRDDGFASRILGLAERLLPRNSRNPVAGPNLSRLAELLKERTGRSRVLVVGGSVLGVGMERLASAAGVELVETDVALGPRTSVICDGHSLPFADGSFDAVVCQAVLEHVADPPKVAEEIWRVLGEEGLVYSEIPFMQQVHEGAYDFTRYTLTGHRRLFRRFDLLAWGPVGGPGMALSWSSVYFARALAGRRELLGHALAAAARLASFWLIYLDRFLLRAPNGVDAAPGTFFMGRRAASPISDRQVVEAAGGRAGGYRMHRG